MADNIEITPGTGKTVATEDVSGVHHQRVVVEAVNDSNAPANLRYLPGIANSEPLLMVAPIAASWDWSAIGAAELTAQTYTSGDSIGGNLAYDETAFAGDLAMVTVTNLTLVDATGTGPDIDVFLSAAPLGTVADGAAYTPTSDPGLVVVVKVRSTDWVSWGSSAKIAALAPNLPIARFFGNVYAVAVARASYTISTDTQFQMLAGFRYE